MKPSDNKKQEQSQQGLKPTKPININERQQLEEVVPDMNWQPTGKHPDKNNVKTHK